MITHINSVVIADIWTCIHKFDHAMTRCPASLTMSLSRLAPSTVRQPDTTLKPIALRRMEVISPKPITIRYMEADQTKVAEDIVDKI
jgi:hypothetical protein